MLFWEIRNKETGECVVTEFCPGNAAEHHMVLDASHPSVFIITILFVNDVFEVDEVEGD